MHFGKDGGCGHYEEFWCVCGGSVIIFIRVCGFRVVCGGGGLFFTKGEGIYAWTDKKTRSRWRWSARKRMQ